MQVNIQCPECKTQISIKEEKLGKKVKCDNCYNVFQAKMQGEAQGDEEDYQKGEVFKPNKWSFFLLHFKILTALLVFLIFCIFASLFFPLAFIGPVFMIFIISLIFFFLISIIYKKEKYTVKDKKIVYNYGNIFSDNQIELDIDKIVQVRMKLGFLQYHLFGTGDIEIKSAGSGSTNITIYNVNHPEKLYNLIQNVMRENGFQLSKDKLVQETHPHMLGVLLEVFGKSIGSLVAIFYFLNPVIRETGMNSYIILLVLLVLGVPAVFSYLDLKRRYYRIYTDSIFFTEGFLTKRYSFLPFENVADSDNQQGFISKIFGIHDVTVSSQGSGNQIKFKNMINGETMMENIRYLKDKTISDGTEEISDSEEQTEQKEQTEDVIGYKNRMEEPLNYDKKLLQNYKMNALKSLAGVLWPLIIIIPALLFFPAASFILLLFIPLVIYKLVIISYTDFHLKESSIESRFSFLTNKHNVFSIEKITKLDLTESLIDKLFGTCSIRFYSIGSGSQIVFKDIKKTEGLYDDIKRKLGLQNEQLLKDFDINFNIKDFIKSDIGKFLVFSVFLLVLIVVSIIQPFVVEAIRNSSSETENIGTLLTLLNSISSIIIGIILLAGLSFLIRLIYLKFFYSREWYSQKIYSDAIESISGIIIQTRSYSLLRHLKGTKTTKYPLTSSGTIRINVAGEQVIQTQNGKRVISNYIQIDFAQNVWEKLDELDELLGNSQLNTETIKEEKPYVANSAAPFALIIGVVLLITFFNNVYIGALILLLGAIITGIIVWSIKVQFFRIEESRIVHRYGIIYKTFHSIRHERIDFIESAEGLLNKIFGNGNVLIYTLGSSATEMTAKDIENYQEFANYLKKE